MEEEISSTLTKLAKKFITNNPVIAPHFFLSDRAAFKRNLDYRYELFPENKIGPIARGKYIYFRATLLRTEPGRTGFYINPTSPAKVFMNGQQIYQSSLLEEASPTEFSKFTVETQTSNELVIQLKKTASGIGCLFGTGTVKGDAFVVYQDVAEKIEGWQMSTVADEFGQNKMLTSAELAQIPWQQDELAPATPANFFKKNSGKYLFATADLVLTEKTALHFAGMLSSTKIFVDDKIYQPQKNYAAGKHQLLFVITEATEDLAELVVTGENGSAHLVSAFGMSQTWAYLGPLREGTATLTAAFSRTQVIEDLFWQSKTTSYYLRPYLTGSLFGGWNYPLGVTLNGLLNYSQKFADADVFAYVHQHLSLCSAYYNYANWDKENFGAPTINHSLNNIDSLDDCGSMAYTLLRVEKVTPIVGSREIVEDIAAYILHTQARLSDGTLYRHTSHSLLMKDTLWADDIYMSLPFLVEYYQLTGRKNVLFDILRQFQNYFDLLWLPGRELFSHVFAFQRYQATEVPWGRGNGWYFLSLSLAMEELADTEIFPALQEIYAKLARGFSHVRGEDRMWHQVLDDPSSYAETSCTAIMSFAFAKNLQYNWVESPLSQKQLCASFSTLVNTMIDDETNLLGVCRGSGFSFDPDYYKLRLLPRINDTHGIGITLTCGCALLANGWEE